MEKFTHVDETNKVCVVVLKDEWNETVAKGIARCSEDDTFNPEAGLKLANARAWSKYFDKAIKNCETSIRRYEDMTTLWANEVERSKTNLEVLKSKAEALNEELKELLSTL